MKTDVNGFLNGISDWSDGIVSLYKEVNEVQTAFNTRLVSLDGELKKQLEFSTKKMRDTYESISPAAKKVVDAKLANAKTELDKLMGEFKANITKAQTKASQLEKDNLGIHADLHKENPIANDQEEALKLEIAKTADECKSLSRQLAKYDGIKGWFAGSTLATLRKSFNEKMAHLDSLNKQINTVRSNWAKELKESQTRESTERAEWMTLQKDISTNSMELANIQKNYDALTFQNAITAITKGEIPSGFDPECETSMKKIKELRTAKDELVEGLIQISGTLATLKGINDGFAAFAKSVAKLKQEQDTYSSLAKLHFEIADDVVAYNGSFTAVIADIKDEKKMAENPKVYASTMKSKIEPNLDNKTIEAMFNSLGKSIDVATKVWK